MLFRGSRNLRLDYSLAAGAIAFLFLCQCEGERERERERERGDQKLRVVVMRLLIRIMRVDASLHMIMMETPSFAMKSLHAKSITNRPSPSTRIVLSSCSSRSYYSACCGERALRCCKQYCTGAAVAALKPLPSDLLQTMLRGFSSSRIVRVPDDRISSSCSKSVRGCSDSSTVASNDTTSQDKRDVDANLELQEDKRRILLQPDGAAAEDDDERRLFTVRENVEGGAIHIIMGPMFAGKTTSLLQRVQDARNAGRKVGLVKSNKDTRYGVAAVVSHDGIKLPCVAVSNLAAFRAHVGEAQYKELEVIGIDEAQFFEDLFEFCQSAADVDRKTLIVSGLDGDFLRRRFGSLLDLIPLADSVTKLRACCELCGEPAAFTFRKTVDTETEIIGGADVYMPVCRHHFVSGQIAVETARNVLHVHQASRTSEGVDADTNAVSASSF